MHRVACPRRGDNLISVASYNIHQWIGVDGQYNPDRVIGVIRELDADIVGLQEVNFPCDLNDNFGKGYIERSLNMHSITMSTLQNECGDFGNLLLTCHEISDVRRIDLSVNSREPRCAIDADLKIFGKVVRVVVTHLGLSPFERKYQVNRLIDELSLKPVDLTLILGDFNLWTPIGRALRRMKIRFGSPPAPKTFPATYPILALDRIWVTPLEKLSSISAHESKESRVASDHLPVKAFLHLN